MIKFFLQAAIAIGLAVAVILFVGPKSYMIIAAIIVVVSAALIFATKGFTNNDENAPGIIWGLMTIMLCSILGAFWPALPIVFSWRRIERHLDDREADRELERE